MQISALAGQIITEQRELYNSRNDEIKAKLEEYKRQKEAIKDYLVACLEELKEEDKKLLREPYKDNFYPLFQEEFTLGSLAREELGINTLKPPYSSDVERLIILETIECENLDTLIDRVKSKL